MHIMCRHVGTKIKKNHVGNQAKQSKYIVIFFQVYTQERNVPILVIQPQAKAFRDSHTTTKPVLGSTQSKANGKNNTTKYVTNVAL